MVYEGKYTEQISFPLGGIGSGCVGLSGTGRLVDWEIFGRPNKQSINGYTHFAIKAETQDAVLDKRILQGDLPPHYIGNRKGTGIHSGYGFGPDAMTMAGFPHFESVRFCGEFPLARIDYHDAHFPGAVSMTAFNPLIPMQEDLSSIPAAFFEYSVTNTSQQDLRYTLAFSLQNPTGTKSAKNTFFKGTGYAGIRLASGEYPESDPRYGTLALCCDSPQTSHQEFWYRGGWSDPIEMFWNDFSRLGEFKTRSYPDDCVLGKQTLYDTCTLAAHLPVKAGETKAVRFVLAWHYPNLAKSWEKKYNPVVEESALPVWKQYYASLYTDAEDVARQSIQRFSQLYTRTKRFKDALFSSSLTQQELDAVSSNLSTLKSPTVLRLENGEFYGFEGCFEDSGCCEGSCQHVWNYAYALPFLFPRLERSMRELEFRYNMAETGRVGFRLQLPLGTPPQDFRACVDGQMGAVIKMYREWKISGDTAWLRQHWPRVKQALGYAWSAQNEDAWDSKKTGVLTGRQHHTLDMELFGPNAWMQGFYLCALKAAAQMAQALEDKDAAREYTALFEAGKAWSDTHLFNGDYYQQSVNLSDKSLLEPYAQQACLHGDSTLDVYWNEEAGEMKYQIGEGCAIDQVIGQWHANNCGLGEIFEPEKVRKALCSIYQNNHHDSVRELENPWRLYSLNDEGGTVICSWPQGRKRPAIPLTYNSETMHGFEYQLASHMLQMNLFEQAHDVVARVREHYDGYKRNPYNEIECGSNYARSMASYGLLLAKSGFVYDMTQRKIGFFPHVQLLDYTFFWSVQNAYGTFEKQDDTLRLRVLEGTLRLEAFACSALRGAEIAQSNIAILAREPDAVKMHCELRDGQEIVLRLMMSK